MRFLTNFQLECRYARFLYAVYLDLYLPCCFINSTCIWLQTVVVIPILPHGVVQLGSSLSVSPIYLFI